MLNKGGIAGCNVLPPTVLCGFCLCLLNQADGIHTPPLIVPPYFREGKGGSFNYVKVMNIPRHGGLGRLGGFFEKVLDG